MSCWQHPTGESVGGSRGRAVAYQLDMIRFWVLPDEHVDRSVFHPL